MNQYNGESILYGHKIYTKLIQTRVPIDLETQGKSGIKTIKEIQGTFCISPKSQGTSGKFFLNAHNHEIKKY